MAPRLYVYRAVVNRVIDGDSVDLDIDLGFDTWIVDQNVRLGGLNTPEIRTRDLEEKERGYAAKAFVQEKLQPGQDVVIVCTEWNAERDKYGRILGEIYYTDDEGIDHNLNMELLESGHAVPYM